VTTIRVGKWGMVTRGGWIGMRKDWIVIPFFGSKKNEPRQKG
jgi:hypothetical protein